MDSTDSENSDPFTELENGEVEWQSYKKHSFTIFLDSSYILNELCLQNNLTYSLHPDLFYSVEYQNMKRLTISRQKKLIQLLHNENQIEEMPKKMKRITKKQQELAEKNLRYERGYNLLMSNCSVQYIQIQTGLSNSQIYHLQRCILNGQSPFLKPRGQVRKITQQVKDWIEQNKESDHFRTQSIQRTILKMVEDLNLNDKYISVKSFTKYIKEKERMSYKKLNFTKPDMDCKQTKKQRFDFVIEMVPALLQDETGICLNIKKQYGWVPKNKQYILESSTKTQHYTILGAMTPNQVLCYTVIQGWSDQFIFMGFISQILKKLQSQDLLGNHIFVFDQASSHQSKYFTNYLFHNIPCVFTPKSSPALNPIELLWAFLKQKLKLQRIPEFRDLLFKIYQTFKQVSNQNCNNFHENSIKYYQKAFQSEDFSGYQPNINTQKFW